MTARIHHAKSRPLPDPVDPGLPPHLRDIALTAMIGTINAPIGANMPAIFLASAKALIDKALRMQRGELGSGGAGAGGLGGIGGCGVFTSGTGGAGGSGGCGTEIERDLMKADGR